MLVFYSIAGAFVGMMIMASQFMLGLTVFFSYLMAMMAITLITDFSSILLDTSDNTIILPRPVESKTFYIARVTHILVYLGQLAVSLSLVPCGVIVYKYGLSLLLPTLIAIGLSSLVAVFVTNTVYLFIMRFANEEKLKSIINYFQIVMIIVLMGGYQILPRLISRFDYERSIFEIHWWSYFIPPIWMSGSLETLKNLQLDIPHIAFILLSIATPLLCLYATNKWLTPFYNKRLLTMSSSVESIQKDKKQNQKSLVNVSKIAVWFTSSSNEKGAFSFVYRMLGRDNKLKLKIYPSFGLILVFGLIFFVNAKKDMAIIWQELPTTHLYLFLIYAPMMAAQTALHEVPFSDDFKANWIYLSTPVEKPGEILLGTLKAIFLKLFVPFYFLTSIAVLFIWGPSSIDDIIFGFCNNFLIIMIMASIWNKYLPLSVPPNAKAQAGNLIRGIIIFICMSIPGLIHYLISKSTWLLAIAVPIQLLLIYILVKNYKNMSWTKIKNIT